MKKAFFRILTSVLAAVMVLAMQAFAFAEDTQGEIKDTNGYINIDGATFSEVINVEGINYQTATIELENDVTEYMLNVSAYAGYNFAYVVPQTLEIILANGPIKVNLNQKSTSLLCMVMTDVATIDPSVFESEDFDPENPDIEIYMSLVQIIITSPRTPTEYADADEIASWAKPAIDKLNNEGYGILIGDDNKNFNPKNNITRYELAVVAAKLAGLDPQYFDDAELLYSDDIASWALPYVKCVTELGIMVGQENDGLLYFNGQLSTTRQEFCKVITDLAATDENYDYTTNPGPYDEAFAKAGFEDEADVSAWAIPYVKVAYYAGFINGADNNGKLYLNPKANITRQEVSVIISNAIDKADINLNLIEFIKDSM